MERALTNEKQKQNKNISQLFQDSSPSKSRVQQGAIEEAKQRGAPRQKAGGHHAQEPHRHNVEQEERRVLEAKNAH